MARILESRGDKRAYEPGQHEQDRLLLFKCYGAIMALKTCSEEFPSDWSVLDELKSVGEDIGRVLGVTSKVVPDERTRSISAVKLMRELMRVIEMTPDGRKTFEAAAAAARAINAGAAEFFGVGTTHPHEGVPIFTSTEIGECKDCAAGVCEDTPLKQEWPRVRDLPLEEQQPFLKYLERGGCTVPTLDDPIQDGYYESDYETFKRNLPPAD